MVAGGSGVCDTHPLCAQPGAGDEDDGERIRRLDDRALSPAVLLSSRVAL